jgi:hypothetical protein
MYEVKGVNVEYLGVGYLHDEQFDSMGIHSLQRDHVSYSDGNEEYTGAPFVQYCPFTLHIYPTKEMNDEYVMSRPIVTIAVLAVFVLALTSLVFLFYEIMVQRRQRLMMNTSV